MANKVPNFTTSKHKQERNAFDLSQTHLFQAAPGMLYPILALDLIPYDAIKINVADYIKSMPVGYSPDPMQIAEHQQQNWPDRNKDRPFRFSPQRYKAPT